MELIKIEDDPTGEFEFCDSILQQDSKNYHTWQYRCWLLEYFVFWEQPNEILLIETLLKEDPYNNSAWNHRYQIVKHTKGFENVESLDSEVEFTLDHLEKHTRNECAWNYLNG